MSPETQTTESQQPTAVFQEYTWVKAKNRRWNSACVRVRPDGRAFVGLKGFDKKHGGPGYIAVEMTAQGLRELAALLEAAAPNAPEDDSEE